MVRSARSASSLSEQPVVSDRSDVIPLNDPAATAPATAAAAAGSRKLANDLAGEDAELGRIILGQLGAAPDDDAGQSGR